MEEAVIIDCIRTPMGRSRNGVFRHVRAETLSANLMQAIVTRNSKIPINKIEDIYWGCVQQTLEQGFNIARNAALLAGLPKEIGAVTINRLCGSSMDALHQASRAIQTGAGEIFIIGGVEHMGHIPMTHGVDFHPTLGHRVAKGAGMMGMTAELLARQYEISRDEQDNFAVQSHQKAHQATLAGSFQNEIVPIEGHCPQSGMLKLVETDEVIRPETNFEDLQKLKPVFDPVHGSITAASSSALSDGASAMLVMSRSLAKKLQVPILALVRGMAVSGCEPSIMGIGPVKASEKALARANLSLADINLIELNEAFAGQSLSCIKALDLQDSYQSKVNLNGGAIALGHPLGCSGARISTTLIHLMHSKQVRYGLATMCIGLGQGIATVFERIDT
ncbi:MAG: acetyl-CoA C-acyltransferase FadA [Shewanellaceae bacterium]|nr:acetyl-CoA C-acyltransferase FadA [Shewanellaceae bacterium]